MPIPDYETLMGPLLDVIRDGQEHTLRQTTEALAARYQLSEAERKEVLPSGRQTRFDNRVSWAKMFLKQAGLVESTGRGRFRITTRGLETLKQRPQGIDNEYLKRFTEAYSAPAAESQAATRVISEGAAVQTPEEAIESGYQKLRRELARELLQQIRASSPEFFEKLVLDLVMAMGYGGSVKDAGEALGQSGDGGVDGIIKEDKLGLDVVYLQAKHWEANVGRPQVQAFAGSLEGFKARKGVLLTTSKFSEEAREYARRIEKRIVLIDGEQLAELMIDHGIGVSDVANYAVKRVDQDYFSED